MDQIKLELQGVFGNDKQIAEAAWTSSTTYEGKELKNESDVSRVVNMLADSKHSVPFESVVFRFWMKIPITTDRQVVTHRIASHSGMSGRYRTMPDEFLEMPMDVLDILYKGLGTVQSLFFEQSYQKLAQEANWMYRELLTELKEVEQKGILTNTEYKRAREFYRGILPQNNMTERVTVINLRSFANFVKLRDKPEAQPEIRYLAQLMLDAVKASNTCPIALAALERNNWSI